jgi:polyhydroxybutyrate depolymerase
VSSRLFVLLIVAALVGAAAGPAIPAGAARVKAAGSKACGSTPVAPPGETQQSVVSGGVTYSYFQHVPPAYDGTTPLPLVVDFHGYSEGAAIHRAQTGLEPFGDAHGFITISPQAPGSVQNWTVDVGSPDDVFVGTLLDQVDSTLCIDTNRVFATGLSYGAFMISAVACTYADRIAAIAPVAGIRNPKGCKPTRPVPVVAIHGTKDPFIAYQGGFGSSVAALPTPDGSGKTIGEIATPEQIAAASKGTEIPGITAAWAKRNGCAKRPKRTKVADDVTLIRYRCPKDAAVELYRVTDGGHSWPGSQFSKNIEQIVGKTTFSISANDIMWKFFEKHPLTKS